MIEKPKMDQIAFYAQYGIFLHAFSTFELSIELGIKNQLKLSDVQTSIVCGGLGAGAKLEILRSLCGLDKSQEKIQLAVTKALNLASRNAFAHGLLLRHGEEDRYVLLKRDVKFSYSVNGKKLSSHKMKEHGRAFLLALDELQAALSITQADIDAYARSVADHAPDHLFEADTPPPDQTNSVQPTPIPRS